MTDQDQIDSINHLLGCHESERSQIDSINRRLAEMRDENEPRYAAEWCAAIVVAFCLGLAALITCI